MKARTSHGGNRFRKDEANSYSRETQSRKVSYAETHPEINCKCDLYAKKLTRVKNSATPACSMSCIQTSEGESIRKTMHTCAFISTFKENYDVLICSTRYQLQKILNRISTCAQRQVNFKFVPVMPEQGTHTKLPHRGFNQQPLQGDLTVTGNKKAQPLPEWVCRQRASPTRTAPRVPTAHTALHVGARRCAPRTPAP